MQSKIEAVVSHGTQRLGGVSEGGFQKLLIVEDDPRMCRLLSDFMEERVPVVHVCSSVAEARSWLQEGFCPDLVLLDYQLPDGNATQLLSEFERAAIWPTIVAITGQAGAHDAFELAQLGVRAFLSKPVTPDALELALQRVACEPPRLASAVRGAVGLVAMHDVQGMVRETMLGEALERVAGNRSRAARLLSVSRQTLQHMLRASDAEHSTAG
jgi:DNA-binding NtrC family response regulator